MIRKLGADDFPYILAVINDAAQAYRGVIHPGLWSEPYMSEDYLKSEMRGGVEFWGYEAAGELIAVMGAQDKGDVTLIRHAYTRTEDRRRGVGSILLNRLMETTGKPILIGTYRDAPWAIYFYERHGFRLIDGPEKDRLLRKYWDLPGRQVETSIVMADERWFERREG
ncbi:MAG: GNAT family N-acetyltransferase [Candidatus Nitrospinota bacterium M3_3B_026]